MGFIEQYANSKRIIGPPSNQAIGAGYGMSCQSFVPSMKSATLRSRVPCCVIALFMCHAQGYSVRRSGVHLSP